MCLEVVLFGDTIHSAGVDLSLTEGSKGLHDGVAADGADSNAALAKLLAAPVVLVVDTRGIRRAGTPRGAGVLPAAGGGQARSRYEPVPPRLPQARILEIRRLTGEWIAMPPIPGTLVVNVGDLLERWSNRRYRSTVHRVINRSGRERLSLVLAYDPNFETLVDPRAFCGEGETPHEAPVICGDYLLWRFAKAFSYRR